MKFKNYNSRLSVNGKYKFWNYSMLKERRPLFFPTITCLVADQHSFRDFGMTEDFSLDTGASISILSSRYKNFLLGLSPVNEQTILFGDGVEKRLPIYNLILRIQGIDFPTKIAFNAEFHSFSVLGNFNFMDQFKSIVLNPKEKTVKLLRQW